MFRRWLSNYIKKNRVKIFIFLIIGLMIGIYLYSISGLTMPNEYKANNISSTYNPSETVISGKNVKQSDLEENNNLIEQFVNFCNNKEYNKAYSLLTDDCKNVLYPNLDKFITNYCNQIFDTYKEFNIQSWINDKDYKIYKIRYIENSLSTGNYTDSKKYEDYITVAKMGENQKLNINQYIGKKEIYKKTKTDELDILVEKADIFLEKVVYTLAIKNKTQKQIQLDGLRESKVAIGLSINGSIHRANKYNLNLSNLIFEPGVESKISLEFANNYSTGNIGNQLIFNDIILDTKEFGKDKTNYNSDFKIKIDL